MASVVLFEDFRFFMPGDKASTVRLKTTHVTTALLEQQGIVAWASSTVVANQRIASRRHERRSALV